MKNHLHRAYPMTARHALQGACTIVLSLASLTGQAGEGYKLRAPVLGAFGGEIAVPADNPGLFGTAILSFTEIYKYVDANGDDARLPAIASRQLNPALPYQLSFPASSATEFNHKQTTVNLLGGYLSEGTFGEGRLAFAAILPLIQQSRSFAVTQGDAVVTPTPSSPPLSAPQLAAVNAGIAAANAALRAQVAATVASQNVNVSGFGDTELSLVWLRHQDRLKLAAGMSLFLPTGAYDRTRGPNPGFGNFYTLRPGVAITYAMNPGVGAQEWDSGVTVAGRFSYGANTENTETKIRSGDFVIMELAVAKVTGNWAFGANVLGVRQVTDDSGDGNTMGANRYVNYAAGPFVTYKLPGRDAGLNLQYSDSFGSRSALVSRTLSLRFTKAW